MSQRPKKSANNHNLSNTKRTGERSEAAFLYQASQRSFGICKPWGDSERYDFILDNRPKKEVHLFRVQVKCTRSLRAGAYETRATYTTGKGGCPILARSVRKGGLASTPSATSASSPPEPVLSEVEGSSNSTSGTSSP